MQKKNTERFLYLKLIGILLIPLILITSYSFFEKEIAIGNFSLQKADISRHFLKSDTLKTDSISSDTISILTENTFTSDTTSQRILFLGDSMVEGLSKRMRQYAAENNHDLLNVIWYSSSTKIWAESDTLAHFLKSFQPTYIMVCLGGNELFVRDLDKREKYIKTIIKQIEDKPYIWIGPPNWKEDTGINLLIEQNTGKTRFFPSKDLTYERSSDGAHPTFASSAKWMDSIAVWISDKSHYRIRMASPQNEQRKGSTTILLPLK